MKFWSAPIIILIALASCGKVEEPQFKRLEDFRLKKLGLQETTIGFKATYYNPNNFGVAVKETALDVYIDSVYLGKFLQTAQVGVQTKAEFSIPLEGKVSMAQALRLNIPSLIGKEVIVQANGSVRIGKAGAFVTKAITYQGKHVLDNNLLKNPAGAGSAN